ncbi:YjiH family protein [Pseudogracilibacillus sp. ICA-222130]|uniref:YjiH family protein n=1 Tax=Pseudogracilibacillus sp. ICA-222130 TaxID=3134655 RepID=UPI0030C5786D
MGNEKSIYNTGNYIKFFVLSFIGIFTFFIPITINDNRTIPLDHIVTFLKETFGPAIPYYILIVIIMGAVYPFWKKTWNKNVVEIILSIFKVIGAIVTVMLVFNFAPAWMADPDMAPYLFDKLVMSVGLIVPVGAVFLALLVGYGLLEFVGVFLQPVMRPIWKTPGRSAIDAVASFVGSYGIGLLITNRVFKKGMYTVREATIIATGFSTVSVTFMIIIAKTLDMMDIWNIYFWVTLVVTFLVTAITVRIWPLSKLSDDYYEGQEGHPEQIVKEDKLKVAWGQAMEVADKAPSLPKNIWINFKDGFEMTMAILPSIMSIGLLGLVLSEYTPLFDIIGYIFYPFTWLMQVPEPLLAAKASAIEIAEMFLPSLLVVDAPLITKFVTAVVSVSAILFFSALIPCILATEIPVSIPKLIVIWIERTILTIIIVTPIAYLLL